MTTTTSLYSRAKVRRKNRTAKKKGGFPLPDVMLACLSQCNLHPQCLGNLHERGKCRCPLACLNLADGGCSDAHPVGKFRQGDAERLAVVLQLVDYLFVCHIIQILLPIICPSVNARKYHASIRMASLSASSRSLESRKFTSAFSQNVLKSQGYTSS